MRHVPFELLLAASITACAAHSRVQVAPSTNSAASSEARSPEAAAAAEAEPAPASAPTTQAPPPGCPLDCSDAHRSHVSRDAEANIEAALVHELAALRTCAGDGPPPAFMLRFDSTGALTHFGVDDERAVGGGLTADRRDECVDAVMVKPRAVSYPGPATLRCVERCNR